MDSVYDALEDADNTHTSSVSASLVEFIADNHSDVKDARIDKRTTIREISGNKLGKRELKVCIYTYNNSSFGVVIDNNTDTGGWTFPSGRYDTVVETISKLDAFIITSEEKLYP